MEFQNKTDLNQATYMRHRNIELNWRVRPIPQARQLKGHDDHVITCLQFCGNRIVSGSDDNTLKVWSATTGKVRAIRQTMDPISFEIDFRNVILCYVNYVIFDVILIWLILIFWMMKYLWLICSAYGPWLVTQEVFGHLRCKGISLLVEVPIGRWRCGTPSRANACTHSTVTRPPSAACTYMGTSTSTSSFPPRSILLHSAPFCSIVEYCNDSDGFESSIES